MFYRNCCCSPWKIKKQIYENYSYSKYNVIYNATKHDVLVLIVQFSFLCHVLYPKRLQFIKYTNIYLFYFLNYFVCNLLTIIDIISCHCDYTNSYTIKVYIFIKIILYR